ncbi:ATPase family associated with various cellular activities (AAA) [Gracilimonas mengyeensis]|uniref:ATPase family associated with various cellular activities (AAA) n=2 Tax=Gracilimonas mengyeensis TaxID=1302730 RepID=A0A521BNL3_9BACT|nr:ATPase family associated with various cellular activities (AAA) [Gracilimonas mengyeensis]
MSTNATKQNAATIQKELDWFNAVLEARFQIYFEQEGPHESIFELEPPTVEEDSSMYADLIRHYSMQVPERLVMLLALIPHIYPQMLDIFFTKNSKFDRGFSEFGGIKGNSHGGFIPTGETALFLLAGNNLELRFHYLQLFDKEHFFFKHNILRLEHAEKKEPFLSGTLLLSDEYVSYFTRARSHSPEYHTDFPAKKITTDLEWDELVLDPKVKEELEDVRAWLNHKDTMLYTWGMAKNLKPGYKCLFYGPSGTGKTLAASLLGKVTGLEVYRVDLSMIVSKYIGETEKNLAGVFDQAEHKNWILFFDEADALFGRRTQTKSSNDRYANQEVAYLLQRIEDFQGVVILATNLKNNIDDAFARRFQSLIHFPVPSAEERYRIWKNLLSNGVPVAPEIDIDQIAEKHEIAGGTIINVLRYSALQALKKEHSQIEEEDLLKGIRREHNKKGKTVL